ncbi:MAG TPA: translation elongation factor Ts [Acidimicrobiales bacterium]|nr:translation elongation factor Ts [Acidimicrobiales bacterium]
MAEFTAKDVQRLRQVTGAGMMDAKKALTENGGDFETSAKWLREKGLASSAKRADRDASEGAVAVASAPAGAAIVELRSETDFVAKSDQFKNLAAELAELVAADGDDAVAKRQTEIDDLKVTLKENIDIGRVVRFEARPGAVVDTYLHIQSGRGKNAVMVELEGGDESLAHDIALHIASSRPRYLRREDVPEAEIQAERDTLEGITRNEGKPEAAVPKIVEGRMNGFFKDSCLLEQSFVKDEKQTVQQILGGATVTRFAQVEIGR